MHRLFAIIVTLSLTLSACSSAPSIWGVPPTPTAAISTQDPLPIDPFAGQNDPIIFLTSTTPPSIATATPIIIASSAVPNITVTVNTPTPTRTPVYDAAPYLYYAQSGDMLSAVANRFGVEETEITSDADLTKTTLIDPGTLLVIPNHITEPTSPNIQIMPDAEIIYSITAVDFDIKEYVQNANGYLSDFKDYLGSTGAIDGDKAIERLAVENSINPRLLLGLLEFEGRWVRGQPVDIFHTEYPMGFNDYRYKGMTVQMVWAINNMSIAYYGWRAGTLTHLQFSDGSTLRIDPRLNAGTVAIQYLFSLTHSQSQWSQIIDPGSGFPAMYEEMFGDPWARADSANPIFPSALNQPTLALPFLPNTKWSLTGGPHNGWGQISADVYGVSHSVYAAIDFAPAAARAGCDISNAWVTASAPGLVVRSENGAVMVDLDGDGYEQTGWNLLYMHINSQYRVKAGTWLETNDHIGHPSCEGGVSTGTHLHFARKYNGEWVTADGPIPFILSGWRVVAGDKAYEGKLVRGDEVVIADPNGQSFSNIIRKKDE
ncbi:MAG: LysM peptidoglycan-binding domain-containing M23 family metallopeptidase [Chloroflexi bacterium]|nr:LysM peptidoglycan-binding domain-containing M23 family metallopeptidase [Chloroflexota bacterium]